MNLAQAVDLETLRLRESGVAGAFARAVRDNLGRVPVVATAPWWKRPAEASAADKLRLKPGSAKAAVIEAIESAGRALTFPEIRAAVRHATAYGVKGAIVQLEASGRLIRSGVCKRYRYGLGKA